MFTHKHYMPILKAREGEFKSFLDLTDNQRGLITPLIEVPHIPWNWNEDEPSMALDDHLQKIADKVAKFWGTRDIFFIDFLFAHSNTLLF